MNAPVIIFVRYSLVLACLVAATPGLIGAGFAADDSAAASSASDSPPLSQAEIWVKQRSLPEFMQQNQDAKKKKTPVRSFLKSVAKGAGQELGTSLSDMGKDMVLVFSVQDIDPYAKKGPPSNKPAIVMKMTMVDGSTAYLHHFPDNSFAVEDGFADGTVMVPGDNGEYIVKYPNNVQGKLVFQHNKILIYRPDKTVTTFEKTASGSYEVSNTKFGYMGTARADDTD
ncbi:MAG: hypothetical protein JST01_07830 [Cyanobacteria bacterium SZAS TMP-1]|nr:hypothetical protein [Cyanobacteria bacterium SZAS TMP-1]